MKILCLILTISSIIFPAPLLAEEKNVSTESECEALGGSWERRGLIGNEFCLIATKDKGKECSDSSECESFCVAPRGAKPGSRVKGVCHGFTLKIGTCLAEVTEGKAGYVLCVD